MVLYLCVALALGITGVLSLMGKFIPLDLSEEERKYRSQIDGISSLIISLAFIIFAIGDVLNSAKTILHAIAVVIIAGAIIYYFVSKYLFTKNKK